MAHLFIERIEKKENLKTKNMHYLKARERTYKRTRMKSQQTSASNIRLSKSIHFIALMFFKLER